MGTEAVAHTYSGTDKANAASPAPRAPMLATECKTSVGSQTEMAAEAKLYASEVEGWVADECLQLHGGAGYMDEYVISRAWRDARLVTIGGGTSEIMREIISKMMGM